MEKTRCTYQVQRAVFINLIIFSSLAAVILFVIGGIEYRRNDHAKAIHEENLCEVTASNYYQSRCSGTRGSTHVCFIPVWMVTYSIFQDVTEIRLEARIEHAGFRGTADAQNKINEYQIGMSYSCWCNVVDTSKARWDEPKTFAAMMILIFGGVSIILCFIGIYFTYRVRKKYTAWK